MERDIIVDKILGNVAHSALLDALIFTRDDYVIERHATSILDKVDYLVVRNEDPNDEYNDYGYVNYDDYIDYEKLLYSLMKKLIDSPNHKEIKVALTLVDDISRFGTWRGIADKGLDILQTGSNVSGVEQLLQMIHQGGYESLNNAKEASRPLLEHVSDRPWEVANALTFVFAGYPLVAGAKLESSINRYAKPLREESGIKEFYQQGPIDINKIYNAARTKFFTASLSLAKKLNINDISQNKYFIHPYLALNIIENEEY